MNIPVDRVDPKYTMFIYLDFEPLVYCGWSLFYIANFQHLLRLCNVQLYFAFAVPGSVMWKDLMWQELAVALQSQVHSVLQFYKGMI